MRIGQLKYVKNTYQMHIKEGKIRCYNCDGVAQLIKWRSESSHKELWRDPEMYDNQTIKMDRIQVTKMYYNKVRCVSTKKKL